jgi:glutathione S-transferase
VDLYAISYSPWSERARWALDHHALPYLPMLGEPALRLRLRRPLGRVTLPVLFVPGQAPLTDSHDICRYADAHGSGPPLLPERHRAAIAGWATQADACLSAGRVRTTLLTARTPSAWQASVPLPVTLPRPVAGAVVRLGGRYLLRKYGRDIDATRCEDELRAFLLALREGLSRGGGFLVGGRLSWADLCAAVALQFVSPVDPSLVPLAPEVRDCWTAPTLARGFGDLLSWRDELYARHRHRSPTPPPALTDRGGAG